MSSYGHFILEVKQTEGWKRIQWKSDRDLDPYLSKKEDKDYTHKYVTVSQCYRMRDSLRQEEFGHTGKSDDFSEETKQDIEKFEGDYGWYEGYFYLNELDNFLSQKKNELEKFKNKNIQQAIYDEVRKISAKLNGEDFKKDKKENIPFDEYYEEDLEWLQEEINSLNYLSCIFYFMVDETCGYTQTSDVRIIVVAG